MKIPIIILGMAIVTFGTRYLVMIYFSKVKMSPILKTALNFVPPVILTAIIIPILLLENGKLYLSINNIPLISGIITGLIAIKTKNLLTTILIGMAIFWGLKLIQ